MTEDKLELTETDWQVISTWLTLEKNPYTDKVHELVYPLILSMIKYNYIYINSVFSNEQAEEWANDVILKLNARVVGNTSRPINRYGFAQFSKKVVHNYLLDIVKKNINNELVQPIFELLEEIADEDGDAFYTKHPIPLSYQNETAYLKYLVKATDNGTFKHLRKWAFWDRRRFSNRTSEQIVPSANVNKVDFMSIEVTDHVIYLNPSSLLCKYELWMNSSRYDENKMH